MHCALDGVKNVTQGQTNQPTNGQGDSGCRKKAKDELLKGEVSRGNNSTKKLFNMDHCCYNMKVTESESVICVLLQC